MKKGKDKHMNTENEMPQTDNLTEETIDVEENTEKKAEVEENQTNKAELKQNESDKDAVIAEWKDKYLRLSAEFDNYRKRTLKEKMDMTKYASEEVLKSILPVIDDLERGIKAMEKSEDVVAVKEGISLIYNKFKDILASKGLKEIEATNLVFDTDHHEAITKIPMPEMSGKVVDVVEKGYMLNEKVIRYAKVVVGE